MKKISIVTVVYNDENNILRTIESVASQTFQDKEYLVIDGCSSDGTIQIIKQNLDKIDKFVSEPDKGIYDAMNKAIDLAEGEWIIFMNSGDVFVDNKVLSNIFNKQISKNINFIYSDYYVGSKLVDSSFNKGFLLHQAVIYKRKMHERYGYYQVTKPYIISDFMFFMRFVPEETLKVDVPIARNDLAGVSNGCWCLYQRLCCDYIYHRLTLPMLIIKIIYWSFVFAFRKK